MTTIYKNALVDLDELKRRAAEGAANAQSTIASLPASAQAQVQSAVPLATRNLTDAQQAAQQKAAQMAAQVNASNTLSSGGGILKNEPVQKTSTAGNAYQQALATATANPSAGGAVTTTPAPAGTVTPQQLNDYTWYNWMGRNDMTTMTDQDKANWQTAMQGWQNGDYSAYNDNFQKAGNWSSYIDDNGNVSGMLRYIGDGVGGYVPVNNGQLLYNGWSDRDYAFYGPNGEVYTADANGRLVRAGNWTPEEKYSALESSVPYKLLKGTATDAEREAWANSVNPTNALQKAAAAGDQDAIAQIAERAGVTPQTPAQQALSAYDRQASFSSSSSSPTPAATQPAAQSIQPVTSQNQNSMYVASPYKEYVDNWSYPDAPEWEGTEYERERDAALERARDMRWNYDPNTDPVWQAYQKQYRREGQRATKEALAQAAGLTGGQMNSYAAQAASQAENYYASQLSDQLPQLYQDSYNRYLQEFQKQLGISDQYEQQGQTEYNRYLDRLGQYNTNRNFDYGRYRDAVGDYRYDQEWAQQLREYADSQNWKAKDWEQYLREYEDKLSNQEREWAYQQYRDAVSDAMYADETAYNRGKYEDETAYQRAMYDREYADEQDQNAWERGYKQTAYNDEMQRTALNYLNTNGIVTGRYAEILGVPDGTTYEQYYSRYLGGGSTSPFEETEIDSGKTQRTTTPPPLYDPEGKGDGDGDGDGEGDGEGEGEDEGKTPPERTDIVGTHKNGSKKTKGYDQLVHYLAVQTRGGYNADFIRQTVYQWAAEDRIADWEIPIVLSELGLWNQSNPVMNSNYEGPIRQYTK